MLADERRVLLGMLQDATAVSNADADARAAAPESEGLMGQSWLRFMFDKLASGAGHGRVRIDEFSAAMATQPLPQVMTADPGTLHMPLMPLRALPASPPAPPARFILQSTIHTHLSVFWRGLSTILLSLPPIHGYQSQSQLRKPITLTYTTCSTI